MRKNKKQVVAAVDEVAKRELILFAENDSKLYPAVLNIIKRIQMSLKKGSYNQKEFVNYWVAYFHIAAQKYAKDFAQADEASKMFDKETLRAAAEEVEPQYKEAVERGEYDNLKSVNSEVQEEMDEVISKRVEGKAVTASVQDYTMTGGKLYGYEIEGEVQGKSLASTPEKAFEMARRRILAAVEKDRESVLADLFAAFKLNPADEEAAELESSLDYEDGADKGTFEHDGTSYEFYVNEDDAITAAEEDVASMWQEDEGTVSDFLKAYLYMTDTDVRLFAADMSSQYAEDLSSRDAVKDAEMQDEFDAAEEADQDTDAIVEKAKEVSQEKKYDEIHEALTNDPVQYFVKDQGIYTEAELMKQSFIHIDYEEAAKAAVAVDGWAHTLSRYDGEYKETPGGMVYFRE